MRPERSLARPTERQAGLITSEREVDTMSDAHPHERSDRPRQSLESLGRRDFLRGLAITGAAAGTGGVLAACGGSGSSSSGTTTTPKAGGKPKRGGALKVGLTGGSGSDTLDPH